MNKIVCDECGGITSPGSSLNLVLEKKGDMKLPKGETTTSGEFSVSRTTIFYNGGGPCNVDLCIDCLIKYLKNYVKQAEDYRESAKK